MNKYLSNILMLAVLLLAGTALTSCTHSDDPAPEPEPSGPKTYTLTIKASKSPDTALTRALSLGINTETGKEKLISTWATTEAIYVKKYGSSTWATGTLSPKEAGSNVDCTGTVKFSETIKTSDQLTLLFPRNSIDYTGQVGTLADIAAKYDYATATTGVTDVSGNTITAAATTLVNQQAIVKFTLIDKSTNAPINANSLTISASGLKVSVPETGDPVTGDITIDLTSSPTNEVYAALSGINNTTVTVTATTSAGDTYVYEKPNATFSNGQYYAINLKMVKSCTTPLTFECCSSSGASIVVTDYLADNLWYKKNDGELKQYTSQIDLTNGDKVCFWGNNATNSNSSNHTRIYCNDDCYVYGNIMSLIDKDNFAKRTVLPTYTNGGVFEELFAAINYDGDEPTFNNILNKDDNDLVLPATTLKANCYAGMFAGCNKLKRAPELPASKIPDYGYTKMFMKCFNLKYIKCLATNTSADYCTYNWVYNAGTDESLEGTTKTFVVNSTLTITGESPTYKTVWGEDRGESGIPEGWTVTK